MGRLANQTTFTTVKLGIRLLSLTGVMKSDFVRLGTLEG